MLAETTGAAGPGRGGRMSRQRKRDAVLRLLRGEDLGTVSRALGVAAATLTAWRDTFLAAGEASLASRPTEGEELESERLNARPGEMLLERELLEAKIAALEEGDGVDGPLLIRTPANQFGRIGFGHQWKLVCGLTAAASKRRQRSATTVSRSANVAKWRLATGSSTSGQRRSAG